MLDAAITGFLADTPWHDWTIHRLDGDASSRSYARLTAPDGDKTVMLMIAPPETCGPLTPFLSIAAFLRGAGLAAPDLHKVDDAAGLAVIEDMGRTDYARWLRDHPEDEVALYIPAADVLAKLERAAPPKGLDTLTPALAAELLDLFFTHYLRQSKHPARQAIEDAMGEAFSDLAPWPMVIALRDYHAENLIWRPDLAGTDRVGILDFQDAFMAPAGYDLVSIIRDARRDVGEETVARMVAHFTSRTGHDLARLEKAIAVLSVQRNLRILGIFARLAQDYGKPKYLSLQPRVLAHVKRDLAHPALANLSRLLTPLLEQTA